MRTEFYSKFDKRELFPKYIATKSSHSRGSTVDLTLVNIPPNPQPEYHPGDKLIPCD